MDTTSPLNIFSDKSYTNENKNLPRKLPHLEKELPDKFHPSSGFCFVFSSKLKAREYYIL